MWRLPPLRSWQSWRTRRGRRFWGQVIQNREAIHPGTYIGKGKIEEVRALAEESGSGRRDLRRRADAGPAAGLEERLELKVMDRTLVILDIFAKHASTSEGKLQVEMAQLSYRLARLSGLGKSLSRPGRRHRNERAGREKAGDRPAADPKPDGEASPGAFGYAAPPGHGEEAAAGAGGARGGHRGLYERGKVHASQRLDRGGTFWRRTSFSPRSIPPPGAWSFPAAKSCCLRIRSVSSESSPIIW